MIFRPLLFLILALILLSFASPMVMAQEDSNSASAASEQETDIEPPQEKWEASVDRWFGDMLVTPLATLLFYDFGTGPRSDATGKVISEGWLGTSVPFVIVWLMGGAIFLTIRMAFINLRGFNHACRVTRGDYDNPDDIGEVTHFQALASALSATVGLGNIAGVAIAVGTGGPGAVFLDDSCRFLWHDQ